jgi:hypothetical protein
MSCASLTECDFFPQGTKKRGRGRWGGDYAPETESWFCTNLADKESNRYHKCTDRRQIFPSGEIAKRIRDNFSYDLDGRAVKDKRARMEYYLAATSYGLIQKGAGSFFFFFFFLFFRGGGVVGA